MIRFYNGKTLLYKNGKFEITSDEVWVDGKVISYVGAEDKTKKFDREIDLRGNLLMPGFKNAHTHSAMTFLRSFADDLPLKDWLFKQVFPMEAKLTGDHIYELTKLAILEYLSSGITASFDMYLKNEPYAAANVDCGFKTVICGSTSGSDLKEVEALENDFNKYNSYDPLVSFILGFHAEYTTDKTVIGAIGELARKYKAPVFTHLSETENEVNECIERHGLTPPALLDSLGVYDFGGGGYHCVHMTSEDIDLFKRKNLFAVSCPASNMKLSSGIAPIQKYLDSSVRVALGTDGPASNNCLDMFREMFLVTALQKVSLLDPAATPAGEVLKMATVNGAHAMGLYDADVIEKGKRADLTVIDLNTPNMQPQNNIVKNLVYSGSKANVKLTMVDGRILYENGEYFVGESVDKIYENANNIIKSLSK